MVEKGNSRSRGSYRTAGVPVSTLLTFFAHLLFIAITTLLLVWLLQFRDGLSFTSTKLFNVMLLPLAIITFLRFMAIFDWTKNLIFFLKKLPWHNKVKSFELVVLNRAITFLINYHESATQMYPPFGLFFSFSLTNDVNDPHAATSILYDHWICPNFRRRYKFLKQWWKK